MNLHVLAQEICSSLEVGVEVKVGLEGFCVVLVHVTDDSWLGGRPCTGLLVVRVRRHRVGGKEALSYLGTWKWEHFLNAF